MLCVDLWDIGCVTPLGAPLPGFIYATGLSFYKCPSPIRIRTFLLHLQVIFESLYLSTTIMGWTRYTNPWIPEGHTHVSSPWVSTWVADSGWVSKLQLPLFSDFSNFFKLWLLEASISSIFDFFNLWLYISSTSNAMAKIVRVLESVLMPSWCVVDSPCAWWMTSPLGTPRGRYDEYSS
jgi:hypothetical protein